MLVEIEIIDRVYRNIRELCDLNGLDIKEYMSNAVMDKYNTDVYGDLNEKFAKKEEKKTEVKSTDVDHIVPVEPEGLKILKEEEIKKEQEVVTVEKKKRGRPKKEKVVEEKPAIVEPVVEEQPKRIRRTLKAK